MTINVRGPEYFREREREEYRRNSIKIVEAQAKEQFEKYDEKYRNGEISKEEYDRWRYNYPKFDTESGWVKVPSQELSDAMVEAFKDHLKDK